jgi:hypothetical protein
MAVPTQLMIVIGAKMEAKGIKDGWLVVVAEEVDDRHRPSLDDN